MRTHVDVDRSRLFRAALALSPIVLAAGLVLPVPPGTAAADEEPPVGMAALSVYEAECPVSVTVVPAADLVPAILCPTWDDVAAGTYSLTCAIVNDAAGTAQPSIAELCINGVTVTSESVPQLGPGESYSFTWEPVILTGDADSVALVADAHGEVSWEVEKSNNTEELAVASPEEVSLELSLAPGWNMVSVPLLLENASREAVFPEGAAVYGWDPNDRCYFVPESIEPTRAYMVAALEPMDLPSITGWAVTSYVAALTPGWHMVGAVWGGTEIARSHSAPVGVVDSPAYYLPSGVGCYQVADTLEAGGGCWVVVRGDCLIQVS